MSDTAEVKRWRPVHGGDTWVRATDYDALAAKLSEVKEGLEYWETLAAVANDRAEAAEAKLAEAQKLQDAQKLFNYYAVEIVTYGATIFRMQNLENAWVNLKTQAELLELKARIQTGEKE